VAWTGFVVWGVFTINPWLVPVCLSLLLGTVVWLHERTLSRAKPGDDAQVRFLGVIRIVLRRGTGRQDPSLGLPDEDVSNQPEAGHEQE